MRQLTAFETIKSAFVENRFPISQFDLIHIYNNAIGMNVELKDFYSERLKIFLNILTNNTHIVRERPLCNLLNYMPNTNYPAELQEIMGVLSCFTDIFYLHRQYSEVEEKNVRIKVRAVSDDLDRLGVDTSIFSGDGRTPNIALYGLVRFLDEIFKRFDLSGLTLENKLGICMGEVSHLREVRLTPRRAVFLAADVFGVNLSEHIFKSFGETEYDPNYVHPYFHEAMSFLNKENS